MALFWNEIFECLGHRAGVTFHEGFPVVLQLLQALAALFQECQFRLSSFARFVYFL